MPKLFVANLKLLYRDKQALFWSLAFPVIFAVVFGLFDFEQAPEVRIGVVAEAPSAMSDGLVGGLREVDGFEVSERASLGRARDLLAEGELDVVLDVPAVPAPPPGEDGLPPALAGSLTIGVVYNQENFATNQFAISAVERIVDGMNLRLAGVQDPPIDVRAEPVSARSVSYYDFLLPGLVAMGVMNASIIGIAVAVALFREKKILKRILATPLQPVRFLTAQVLARLVLSLVQAALILAVGVYLFGAEVYGNVVWIFVLAVVANLIFLNLGFAVAGRAPNPDAAQGVANFVALPMMFLSGVFFPTDTLPEVLQTVVRYLPLTPLIEALRTVSVDGESITATLPQLGLLGAWIVGSFLIAARNFRFAKA